jgi:sirohydrochlorin ferrochelatase
VREGPEGLGPDNAEVAGAFILESREAAVEDISEHVTAQASDGRFAAEVAVACISRLLGRGDGVGLQMI